MLEMTDDNQTNGVTEEEIRELEKNNLNRNKVSAEKIYISASKKRKRRIRLLLVLLFVIEFFAALYFTGEIEGLDFKNRIVREQQMRQSGKIELSTGTYTGETDFGNFSGQGKFSFITGAVYSGEWKDNQIAGQGILEVPDEGTA